MAQRLASLDNRGLRRSTRVFKSLPDGRCEVDGRSFASFCGSDYLGLSQDSRVIAAAQKALSEAGVGSGASAVVSGFTPQHAELVRRLAEFTGEPDALLFPTGYAANVGTLTALMGSDDVVFCDRLNHASLVDGCGHSGARFRVYRHDRLDRLERELAKSDGARRRFLVTDGVFSMDGHVAPLNDLCSLAERFDAAVVVDEAHATGVYGRHGRGVCEQVGVQDRVAVRIGTLSKALGALGGFVTGSTTLTSYILNHARTQFFSTALPPAVCAAATAAVDIVETEPSRRRRLRELAGLLRSGITDVGMSAAGDEASPIVPVVLGDVGKAVAAAAFLQEHGFLVPAIRPPTVPQGTARLRFSVSTSHQEEDIRQVVDVLRLIR